MPVSLPLSVRPCLVGLAAAAISAASPATAQERAPLPDYVIEAYGTPPAIPTGPLSPDLEAAIEAAFVDSVERSVWGDAQREALATVAASGDPRVAWLVADLMRFVTHPQFSGALAGTAAATLGIEPPWVNSWGVITDQLIAWDIPAPPDYLPVKRTIFTNIIPGWENIFVEGDVDWRHVSWGGVLIDARPFDTTDEPCNCIPAADNPEVTSAEAATWLDDDDIVFGISLNGEHRAYPRQIMEVHEMVNDTLGGRDLGIPYCTLCGSA